MTVEERVLHVITTEIHRRLRVDELDCEFQALGIDSLDRTCILFGIEREFSLQIPESELEGLSTVRQIVERLDRHLAAALH